MVYGSRPKTRTVYVFEREEVEIPLLSFFFSLSLFLLFREDSSDDEDSSEEKILYYKEEIVMTIKMNKEQKAAFQSVEAWLHAGNISTFYLLRGYAGVGKTTMAMEIAKAVLAQGVKVAFVAPTNKAVRVIDEKLDGVGLGLVPRTTVHKAIYQPNDEEGSGFHYHPDKKILPKRGLVVCDEASMVPQSMLEDLARAAQDFGFRVLLMGDSFQLPPVSAKGVTVFQMGFPESELTQVMRQAGGSGILDLATALRANGGIILPNGAATDVSFMSNAQILQQYVADLKAHKSCTCIAWTNRTRVAMNHAVRVGLFGAGNLGLHAGEKVIGVDNGENLVNGEEAILPAIPDTPELDMIVKIKFYHGRTPVTKDVRLIGFKDENCQRWLVAPNLDEAGLLRGAIPAELLPDNWREERKTPFGVKYSISKSLNLCTFGYVITAHKSQGSQWDKVYVTEVQKTGDQVMQARWFYTAVTRAAKELVLSTQITGRKASWEQISAIAAPFMTANAAQKVQPVQQQPIAKAQSQPKVEKPKAETKAAPSFKASFFTKFEAVVKAQQAEPKKEVKVAEPNFKSNLFAKFDAALATKAESKKKVKQEETPVVVKPVPSEKKVEAPSPKEEDKAAKEAEKAAKAKKIEEVNAMPTFVPSPKGKDESNRSFALRLAGF